MMLYEYNHLYETILHSNLSDHEKNMKLSSLMSEMESEFKIPMIRKPEWEEKNRAVIAMYRKLAKSRKF